MNAKQLHDDLLHKAGISQCKPILVQKGETQHQAQVCYDTDNLALIIVRLLEAGQEQRFIMSYERVARDLDEHGMIKL